MPFTISKHLSVRMIEEEIFILNRSNAHVHTFNKTGVFLWKQLASCDNVAQLTDRLIERFDIERPQAEADVTAFLQCLQEQHLVQNS